MAKVYYYWYFDELKNTIKLNHVGLKLVCEAPAEFDSNIKENTKTYTSIADAMQNAPKFAEIVHV